MKVLIVASGNVNYISPFVLDQVNALKKRGVKIDFFLIRGKGIFGYIKNYKLLLEKIKIFEPNLVHAHYGLSGLFSSLQKKIPVVTTFHGSDINMNKIRFFSKIADFMSSKSIFVSYDLARKLKKKESIIIPCGVNLDMFYPVDKNDARRKLGIALDKKYVLFSSNFDNTVKNYPLAKESISNLKDDNVELIQLKGYDRNEVALLMNAVDAVLMTSFTEGSPQFIKEAMACNTPIISVSVGDVKGIIKDTDGCYLVKRDSHAISYKILEAFKFNGRTNGRKNIKHFDNELIAEKIINVYYSILN